MPRARLAAGKAATDSNEVSQRSAQLVINSGGQLGQFPIAAFIRR